MCQNVYGNTEHGEGIFEGLRDNPQVTQGVKMHPQGDSPAGGQHFLSSPLGSEVPRAWRGRKMGVRVWPGVRVLGRGGEGGCGTLLQARLLLANRESAHLISCAAPLETDPISTHPISFVDICKWDSVNTAFVSGLKSQSIQVGLRRGTQPFVPS